MSSIDSLERQLEGPGSDARLAALQRRFRQGRDADPKPMGLAAVFALSLAAFATVLAGGLWLLG
jgi:hypothetical protein